MHAVYLTVASLIEPEAATAGSVRAIVREEVAVVVEILNCDRFAKEKSLGLVKIRSQIWLFGWRWGAMRVEARVWCFAEVT